MEDSVELFNDIKPHENEKPNTPDHDNYEKFNMMNFTVIATSVRNNYDEWCNNSDIMNVLDVEKNTICKGLLKSYPDINIKVVQSIALAFTIFFYLFIENYVAS